MPRRRSTRFAGGEIGVIEFANELLKQKKSCDVRLLTKIGNNHNFEGRIDLVEQVETSGKLRFSVATHSVCEIIRKEKKRIEKRKSGGRNLITKAVTRMENNLLILRVTYIYSQLTIPYVLCTTWHTRSPTISSL